MYPYYEPNDEIYYIEEFPWMLDIPKWELTDRQKELMIAANMLQEYKLSTRGVAKDYRVPKSTLLDFIHGECKCICSELSSLCIRQLKWNKENSHTFMKWPRSRRIRHLK
ncbi:MAG: hypothetical protein NC548_45695 [Lachnospiraceae bacterium]|nr:hypothetical protein [Lachnospiraceae bacterium]